MSGPAATGSPVHPAGAAATGWHAHLALHYSRDGERTVAHDRHTGPLRVLRRLYPEGPSICHHVLVHPPGGIVGGDVLALDARLDAGSHAVVTTPGATRFYRSAGAAASQSATLLLADGARLEWLPQETIAHSGCDAGNRVVMRLDPGAELLGWDVLALGLPASDDAFERGVFRQHLELAGPTTTWLDSATIAAADTVLLDGALGFAGDRVAGTLWFAAGAALAAARRDALLDAARARAAQHGALAGATCTHEPVVVLRALAARVEPLMALFRDVRADWRRIAWALAANPPRVWRS